MNGRQHRVLRRKIQREKPLRTFEKAMNELLYGVGVPVTFPIHILTKDDLKPLYQEKRDENWLGEIGEPANFKLDVDK